MATRRPNGIRPYWQAIPELAGYSLVTALALGIVVRALRLLAAWALASQGRVAVTAGDFAFLFTSWQGWTLICAALIVLYLSVALDLNVKIAYAGHVVRGERVPIWTTVAEGFSAISRFLCPAGAAVVLYVALIAPLLGVGVSISLTEGLKIPSFISSVITASPLYSAAYAMVAVVFSIVGILNIFCIHGVVIDGLDMRASRVRSRALMRQHWKDYLLKTVSFGLLLALALIALALVAQVLPFAVLDMLGVEKNLRFWTLLASLAGSLLVGLASFLITPFTLIRITQLYVGYCRGAAAEIPAREKRRHPVMAAAVAAALALCVAGALICDAHFDELFPAEIGVRVIAHRGGGNEGPENTVAGLRAAAELGAWGSEIDIQRTADGFYVVTHDATFRRTAGDARRPGDMTLEEVRRLSVDGEPVATYEEMLDAARERDMILFVELKGASADRQMADDAVRIARERGMLDACVFISLDYQLIAYLEGAYPDARTGFLSWAGYGDIAALNCDYLALEELSATSAAIDATHDQGKEVFVWTVNDPEAQHRFLLTDADAIITDNVAQANDVRAELEERDDIDRIVDTLLGEVW